VLSNVPKMNSLRCP